MPAGPPPAITHVVDCRICSPAAGTRPFWHVGPGASLRIRWPGDRFPQLVGQRRTLALRPGFVLQTIVVMPVVLALAYGLAVLLDGALGQGIRLLLRLRHLDPDRQE